MDERVATDIFQQAIQERRAGELMACLFEGGSATRDRVTGKLVLADAAMLAAMGAEGDRVETEREKKYRQSLEYVVRRAQSAMDRGDTEGAVSWRRGLVSIEEHSLAALTDG